MTITLCLPWPPSLNSYYRSPNKGPLAGRHLISARGRLYRVEVVAAGWAQLRLKPMLTGRLYVYIDAYPPDKRKRDLDNLLKALFDALTHAGVWVDDSQIDRLAVERRPPAPNGRIDVTIESQD